MLAAQWADCTKKLKWPSLLKLALFAVDKYANYACAFLHFWNDLFGSDFCNFLIPFLDASFSPLIWRLLRTAVNHSLRLAICRAAASLVWSRCDYGRTCCTVWLECDRYPVRGAILYPLHLQSLGRHTRRGSLAITMRAIKTHNAFMANIFSSVLGVNLFYLSIWTITYTQFV